MNSLLNQKKTFSSFHSSDLKSITEAWINRWLINRIDRSETIEKLSELGPISIQQNLRPNNSENNIINFKQKQRLNRD